VTPKVLRHGAIVLVIPALLSAACSKGGTAGGTTGPPSPRPSSTAKLEIVSPTNGQEFQGASVDVPFKLALTGARIVPATTQDITPDTGHVHVYLDNQIVGMNFSVDGDIPHVTPGQHILRAEFVAADHLPFDPRVFVSVTFEVTP
jgi:hypothetical protein